MTKLELDVLNHILSTQYYECILEIVVIVTMMIYTVILTELPLICLLLYFSNHTCR